MLMRRVACVLLLLSGCSVALNGQQMTLPHISADVSDVITVVPFHPTEHKSFNTLFERVPAVSSLQSASFVVTNISNQPITGISVQWILTTSEGKEDVIPSFTHSYLSSDRSSLIEPQRQMMIVPGSFVRDSAMSTAGFIGTVARDETVQTFRRAVDVRVEINCVLFADGTVVGPRPLPLLDDIENRQIALRLLLNAVNSAKQRGEDPKAALREADNTPSSLGGAVDRMRRKLSRQIQSARDFDQAWKYIRDIQPSPQFHRKDGSSL